LFLLWKLIATRQASSFLFTGNESSYCNGGVGIEGCSALDAAFFEFSAAAAGAWIVASDLGFFSAFRIGTENLTVHKKPLAVDLSELSQFMMIEGGSIYGVMRDEFNPAPFVTGGTVNLFQYLNAGPLCGFCPFATAVGIEFFLYLGTRCLIEKFNCAQGIRSVACPHQLHGGLRSSLVNQKWFAALFKDKFAAAGTIVAHTLFSALSEILRSGKKSGRTLHE
jgi:hypothetical protein